MIPAHGGRLVNLLLPAQERHRLEERLARLPALPLDAWHTAELRCLATGVYSPLTGFMGRADYWRVLEEMRLEDGRFFPLQVVLPVPSPRLSAEELVLRGRGGLVGMLRVREVFRYDPRREAAIAFGTEDPAHPGVARLLAQPPWYAAGEVRLLRPGQAAFPGLLQEPRRVRARLARRGWRRVVGFQTRNPLHRAHEYLLRCALELSDGVLVQPLVGPTRREDLPASLRLECCRLSLAHFPAERVLLAAYPAPMRYAGPREALLHALARQNFGCSHFIVGRDHAGVGSFYRPWAAREAWEALPADTLAIQPLFFEAAFHCRACGGIGTAKTCPHPSGERLQLSGSDLRRLLGSGKTPAPEVLRPEVAALLAARWKRYPGD